MKLGRLLLILLVTIAIVVGSAFLLDRLKGKKAPGPGETPDEAQQAGRDADSLKGADEDYYADMDYGVTHDPELVRARLDPFIPGISAEDAVKAVARGRNNWVVWTAGNDRLWDELSRRSVGILDLLKTVSSHPELQATRDNRWEYLGLVNEPCYEKPTGPREDRFGLWLDTRSPDCPPDPFEDETKYPGVKYGARGDTVPLGSYYGYGTGIVGLRLFPNPAFDAKAKADWKPDLYYTDPDYYNRADLVKPYRVGMSCGFCHVGPNPTNPPADPENPTWANLNSNPGAQYFWIDRIFAWDHDYSNFAVQLFHTSRPGALDTSLVSSDQITNPRTMNAVYNLAARLENARRWGREKLTDGGLGNKQLNEYVPADTPLTRYYEAPDTVWTPRVLKDGSDSVGALGALNRVYVNIGLFSEEWLTHFIPLLGGADITPFPIKTAEEKSAYWRANVAQTPDTALFFLATARPDDLANAPGGAAHQTLDAAVLDHGKRVFATTCARCHSSKVPEKAYGFFPDEGCVNGNYLQCWDDYWQWTKTDEFKQAMTDIVLDPTFRDENYLSTELRIPVTLLETNACSPLATNAIDGNIWNDFSSQSYKDLPAVGTIQVHHPYTGEVSDYAMPAGGRGYTRPASLISVWSTAPYLLNNTLGDFYWTGSVEDRLSSFDSGIRQLLWPENRKGDLQIATASGKTHPGVIDGTTDSSYLRVSSGFLPKFLQPLTGLLAHFLPNLFADSGVVLGPIPQGTPVSLISNIDLQKKDQVLKLLIKIKRDLKALPVGATDEQAREVFKNLVKPLIEVSKCPDFVVNRGHYFGTDYLPAAEGETPLSDDDKNALIEFLKTL